MKYVAGGDVLDAVVAAVEERAVAVEWLSANAATVLAAVPVAGQRHELGQGSRGDRWTRVRVRQLTARARHHVVQPHRLRPRVPPAQRYLGADLRSITHLWALGHGPRFPTAPADIPVLEGWGIVALCAATLLILSAQSG